MVRSGVWEFFSQFVREFFSVLTFFGGRSFGDIFSSGKAGTVYCIILCFSFSVSHYSLVGQGSMPKCKGPSTNVHLTVLEV